MNRKREVEESAIRDWNFSLREKELDKENRENLCSTWHIVNTR